MSTRNRLTFAFGIYLLFVVYGSLVPFVLRDNTLEGAWQLFLNIRYLQLGVGSRADWVANILLYVPLSFLGCAWATQPRGSALGNGLRVLGILLFCLTVAFAVEFAQIFFAPRTVSRNDLIAEFLGTIIGVCAWVWARSRLIVLWNAFAHGGRLALVSAISIFGVLYLALSLFPFDFLVSFEELRWKVEAGRHGWIIAAECGGLVRCIAKFVAELASIAPLGLLIALRAPRMGYLRAFGVGVSIAVVLEVAQFFLASGVTQGLSVVARGAGVVIGAWLATFLAAQGLWSVAAVIRRLSLPFAPLYVAALGVVSGWWSGDWVGFGTASERLAAVSLIPFYYHYFTTETVAMLSLLAHSGMYAPVGVSVWAWRHGSDVTARSGAGLAAGLAAGIALLIELGKLFVPPKHPDFTNLLIAAASAAGTVVLLNWVCALIGGGAPVHAKRIVETPRRLEPERTLPRDLPLGTPAARAVGGAMAALALFAAARYPVGAPWLVLGLAAYGVLLWRRPALWLLLVPAAVPLLDFAPITGRRMLDELDLLLMVTLAVLLWRQPKSKESTPMDRLLIAVLLALGVSWLVSTLRGLWPLLPFEDAWLGGSHTPWDALRVGKGFLWAIILLPFIRRSMELGAKSRELLIVGVVVGLAGAGLVVAWERLVFTGLFDFATPFRVTGAFSTMFTGGSHIEAYLAMALPFLVVWMLAQRTVQGWVLGGGLVALSVYALLVTFSRGGYLGGGVAVACAAAAVLTSAARGRVARLGKTLFALSLIGGVALAATMTVLQGSFAQSRFAKAEQDMGVRLRHWEHTLSIMEPGISARLFGMGIGQFPLTYLWNSADGYIPATFRLLHDADGPFLRLGAGQDDTLYVEQVLRAPLRGEHRLNLEVRSAVGSGVSVALCEKAVLYSFGCEWARFESAAQNAWQSKQATLSVDVLGDGGLLPGRTVKLSLSNPAGGTMVDVRGVSLVAPDGKELIQNGDFEDGLGQWLFAVDNPTGWHVENLLLDEFFSKGLLGLVSLVIFIGYLFARLLPAAFGGDRLSVATISAVAGISVVGLLGSPLESPRIAFMFYLLGLTAIVNLSKPAHPTRRISITS